MTLAVTVLAGLGGGYWLDGRLGTRPAFMLVGGSLAVVAALVYFIRTVSVPTKDKTDRKP
jgi:F0F1-type ATP synthase assembly protein I